MTWFTTADGDLRSWVWLTLFLFLLFGPAVLYFGFMAATSRPSAIPHRSTCKLVVPPAESRGVALATARTRPVCSSSANS